MSRFKINQRLLLAIAWIVLIVWAAGLVYWWQQQNIAISGAVASLPGQATQDGIATEPAGSLPAANPAADNSGAVAQAENAAQTWQVWQEFTPLERTPGPLARAEDTVALARTFDPGATLARIEHLASPPFAGRRAGTAGGYAAGDYIAQQFARYGLQPAGDLQPDGGRSYFQTFPLDYFLAYAEPPLLEVFGPDGQALHRYRFRRDFSSYIRDYAGQGEAEGPVVWANYCRHDDFGATGDDLDVVGAIVLCRLAGRGRGGEDPTRNAIEHGAAGLLLVSLDSDQPIDRIGRYREPLVPVPLPTFVITPAVVDDLLTGSGYTTDDLTIQFQGLPLATTAHLKVALEQREGVMGRNVLGLIPGADPDHADEVVMIGAHYDHLGSDPDGLICTRERLDEDEVCRRSEGAVWWGANDNASGAATLLEIARQWQEAGYTPRRTVLFAAWDAEEQGLWGSSYYVAHPTVPLTNTDSYLNLDMVGTGSRTLAVDGPGPVAQQLLAAAPGFAITATLSDSGGSDHVSFREAGVDASLLIWFVFSEFDSPGLAHYHRPLDRASDIPPHKLEAAGELASLTLLSMASVEPELESLVQQRAAAIASRDRNAFLATSTPSQRPTEEAWWDDLMATRPETVSINLDNPVAVGDVATGTLRYQVALAGGGTLPRAQIPVRFRRLSGQWRLDGPALHSTIGQGLTIFYPADRAALARQLLDTAAARYAALQSRLGRGEQKPARLYLHQSREQLRAAAGLSLPGNVTVWAANSDVHIVPSAGITRTEVLTQALTQLLLAQAGVREEQAPWLWHGLPLHLAGPTERQAQPRRYLASLQSLPKSEESYQVANFPSSLRSQRAGAPDWEAAAWAATGYLLDRYGEAGTARLIAALATLDGATSPAALDNAFQRALGISTADFDDGWQSTWRSRIQSAQVRVDELLARRVEAVLGRDQALFMAQVDPTNPIFLAEEAAWFRSLSDHPLERFELSGQVVGLAPDGLDVQIQATWQPASGQAQSVTYQARLPDRDGRLFYAGPQWLTLAGGPITLHYHQANASLVQALLPLLEDAYQALAGRLSLPARPLAIKLYNSAEELRLAVAPGQPADLEQWTAPGESIRLLVKSSAGASAAQKVRAQLVQGLVDQLLLRAGLRFGEQTNWLRAGLGRLALEWIDPTTGWQQANRLAPKAANAARRGQAWPLTELPWPDDLATSKRSQAQAQALDTTRYLLDTYGRDGLAALLHSLAQQGVSLDSAMQAALGVSLADFERAWRESAATLHVPADWIALAQSFDGPAALRRAADLAAETYEGRETGTPAGQRAAAAIAEAFREFGLQPALPGGSYRQPFTVTHAAPLGPPALVLHRDGASQTLVYRQDFVEWLGGHAAGGTVTGPLVWVRDPEYSDMRLNGKVVLRKPTGPVAEEVRRAAQAGASALILASDVGPAALERRVPISVSTGLTQTLPVLQLTKSAFEALLDFGEHTLVELNTAPDALRLSLTAEVVVPLDEPAPRQAANILGLIPGSDPDLADDLVILSAHYDGPGRGPDGTFYPAAVDNASGVAVLLEVARAWQEAGVQPARSVLFAAWDGEELGQLGARAYLQQPVVPLTQTVGVINLDSVGGGKGFFLTYQGDRSRDALLNWAVTTAAEALDVRADAVNAEEDSDQTAFQEAGIPALLLMWDEAEDDANSPEDAADQLDEMKLRRAGRIATLALRWLAR